jgi:hypothetical protein
VAWASAQSEIEAATGRGDAVFVIVTEPGNPATPRAMEVARLAAVRTGGAAVVLLDRTLAENRTLVDTYRVLGAPVPLILVVAPNGVVAGGALLRDATPEVLVGLVPTPRKAELLLHLSQRRPVFVVVTHGEMANRGTVFEACTAAVRALEHKAATIVVDLRDRAEAAFVRELQVDPRETEPVTTVFNAQGQKTGKFRGLVTPAQLLEAARKRAACCPGGDC